MTPQGRDVSALMLPHAGLDTPPLSRGTSGPFRIRELLTGVGKREP